MPWRKGNRLQLVPESEAPPGTARSYQEIKDALGLPFVPLFYQSIAAYPVFLDLHWRAFRPVVLAPEFFHLGERLRADAYTRGFNYLQVPDLCSCVEDEDRKRIEQLVELLHYKNSLLMLIAAAQFQAFDMSIGRTALTAGNSAQHPVFLETPTLIDEQQADPLMRRIFDDIRRTLGVPHVSYDWRALALWPQFLAPFWAAVKGLHESPMFEGSQYAVRETAWALARELPRPIELTLSHLAEAGTSDGEIASIGRIVELFVTNLSVLVLTTAMARIALDGGTPVHHRAEPVLPDRAKPASPDHAEATGPHKPKDGKEQAA